MKRRNFLPAVRSRLMGVWLMLGQTTTSCVLRNWVIFHSWLFAFLSWHIRFRLTVGWNCDICEIDIYIGILINDNFSLPCSCYPYTLRPHRSDSSLFYILSIEYIYLSIPVSSCVDCFWLLMRTVFRLFLFVHWFSDFLLSVI